jgi:hypothetical protein
MGNVSEAIRQAGGYKVSSVASRLAAAGMFLFTGPLYAQSTPSEFAELSLQELLNVPIYTAAEGISGKRWTLSYHYSQINIEGYQDGSRKLSKSDVLWSPGETRTSSNFPIVPTKITQQVHWLAARYQAADWTLSVSLPYIEQSTDHISTIPGYERFRIESDGVGDMVLNGSTVISQGLLDSWTLSVGLSLPTGSIDEEGNTPRGPGNQQLPYTMQLGSGTYDLPLSVSYRHWGEHNWTATLSAKIRTGKNDRSYRLGNYWRLSGQYDFAPQSWGQPYVGLAYEDRQQIHGQDDEVTVAGAFPYPASITNPELFGGSQVDAKLGIAWFSGVEVPGVEVGRHALTAEVGVPVYQHVNGPQPRETWQLRLSYDFAL